MFHSFRKPSAKWFDSVTDGWNPIIVRELRRLMRSWIVPIVTFAHLGLLSVIHVVDLKYPQFPEFFEIVFRVAPTYAAMFLGSILILVNAVRVRLKDELLDITPLTPKQNVHGFLGTSCILSTFFLVQALPFLAFPTTFSSLLPIRLGILMGYFFVAQISFLFFLSFFIRAKTTAEAVITFLVVIYPGNLGTFVLEGPFFIIMLVWEMVLHLPALSEDVLASWPFIVVASIGGVLAVLSFTYLAYRSSLHHFANRSKSCWRAMFNNLGFYLLWSSFWAVVVFVVVLCFSG